MLHQPGHVDARIVDQREAGIDDLAEVVRRDVGRHADRDTRRAVDQQVRNPGRHDRRLGLRTVVVVDEVDGFLVDVGQHLVRDLGHANLGVTHGGRRVAVDRTEVALPVDQHVPHREWLRHADDRVVDGRIAVRVVLTDHVTDDAGGLLVGLVVVVSKLAHGVQNPAVYRFQAVTHVRQRAADDDAHRVIEIGLLHLFFERDRQQFLGDFRHTNSLTASRSVYRGGTAGAKKSGTFSEIFPVSIGLETRASAP